MIYNTELVIIDGTFFFMRINVISYCSYFHALRYIVDCPRARQFIHDYLVLSLEQLP